MSAEHDCCHPVPSTSKASGEACCAIPPKDASVKTGAPEEPGKARTTWAALGLGVLASACCWVPLALAGVGVATGTLGAKIAWIRPWALWGLVLLLVGVLGWWARKRFFSVKECGDCAVVTSFPTLSVVILAASFLLAWASPRILHPGRNTTLTTTALAVPAGGTLLVISTPQFDCAPCVGTLPQTMQATPGVASVQMDFDKRETRVVFLPGVEAKAILARWKTELGFDGKELKRQIQ